MWPSAATLHRAFSPPRLPRIGRTCCHRALSATRAARQAAAPSRFLDHWRSLCFRSSALPHLVWRALPLPLGGRGTSAACCVLLIVPTGRCCRRRPRPLPACAVCRSPGFYVVEDEPPEVLETAADGVTPLVVAPRIELTLEWLIESPPPEHTWEEPPIFYDGKRAATAAPRACSPCSCADPGGAPLLSFAGSQSLMRSERRPLSPYFDSERVQKLSRAPWSSAPIHARGWCETWLQLSCGAASDVRHAVPDRRSVT